jgi:hypothetical protein
MDALGELVLVGGLYYLGGSLPLTLYNVYKLWKDDRGRQLKRGVQIIVEVLKNSQRLSS